MRTLIPNCATFHVSLNDVHFFFWIHLNRQSTAEHQYLLPATLTLFNHLLQENPLASMLLIHSFSAHYTVL